MGGQYVTAAAKVGKVGWLPHERAVGVVRSSTGTFYPLRAIFVSGGRPRRGIVGALQFWGPMCVCFWQGSMSVFVFVFVRVRVVPP